MTKFPMTFRVRASTEEAGIEADWFTYTPPAPDAVGIKVSIPPEFGGPGVGESPESLYAMALLNCFVYFSGLR